MSSTACDDRFITVPEETAPTPAIIENQKILHCPFCGSEMVVVCGGKGFTHPDVKCIVPAMILGTAYNVEEDGEQPLDLIKLWNTRRTTA